MSRIRAAPGSGKPACCTAARAPGIPSRRITSKTKFHYRYYMMCRQLSAKICIQCDPSFTPVYMSEKIDCLTHYACVILFSHPYLCTQSLFLILQKVKRCHLKDCNSVTTASYASLAVAAWVKSTLQKIHASIDNWLSRLCAWKLHPILMRTRPKKRPASFS